MLADNIGDKYIEMLGKLKVALIATRNGHYCASSIASQHIFTDPNRHFPAVKGINSIRSGKGAGDFLFRHTLPFTTAFYIGDVCFYLSSLCFGTYIQNIIQLRCQYTEVHPKNGIRK